MLLNSEKMINLKISKDKFQITGCKHESHYIECIKYLYENILLSQKITGEKLYYLKPGQLYPKIIFNVVMKNIDFKLGFSINRELLDTFIRENTEFISCFDGSVATGVNIKIKSNIPYETTLKCMEVHDDEIKYSHVDYSEYFTYFSEKEKKKEAKKKKYHTFLVFCSGSVIQSGSGPEMETVYNNFMSVITRNKSLFEEKLTV